MGVCLPSNLFVLRLLLLSFSVFLSSYLLLPVCFLIWHSLVVTVAEDEIYLLYFRHYLTALELRRHTTSFRSFSRR